MNDGKSRWVIEQVQARAAALEDQLGRPARIGCLGLAFKPDVDDLRESPALHITTELLVAGLDVCACEPNLSDHSTIKLHSIKQVLAEADLLVFLVAHSPFKDPNLSGREVFDLCGVTERSVKLLSHLRTSKQLGWRNCAAVVAHRVALRAGLYQRHLPIDRCAVPEALAPNHCKRLVPFGSEPWYVASQEACLTAADALPAGRATWFSYEAHEIGSPPDWFLDPASGQRFPDGRQHWSRCKPFSAADIKRCWELSRWGWAPLLARAWRLSGDSRYLDGLNAWSQSRCQANPVNGGSNWLCGQEASMRLLHALQAWQLSDAPGPIPTPTPERLIFVASHLQRIAATERYAQAQDNNHWTSEAAALFIGGSWLVAYASSDTTDARRWAQAGRRALDRSVGRLVMPDGSFAQHSLTYHRLLLDTLAQVELWRRWLDLEPFSERFYSRCCAATSWLIAMVDYLSGDGPNLGSNDGAFCYGLHSQPYRDFRPTLQLAAVIFQGLPALPAGPLG